MFNKTHETQTQFQQRFSTPTREFGALQTEQQPALTSVSTGFKGLTQRFNALPLIWKASLVVGSVYGVQWLLKTPNVTKMWSKLMHAGDNLLPNKQQSTGADLRELSRLNGDFSQPRNASDQTYQDYTETIPAPRASNGINYTFDDNPLSVNKDAYSKSPIPM